MTRQLTTLAKKKLVISALEDIKARDILAIDVRKITSMFDWIVVASAASARQTKALARHVRDTLKAAGCAIIGTEGEEGAEWVLVDSGDIVAHIMQPAVRAYYDLEELWGEGKFDRPANPTSHGTARLARASEEAEPQLPHGKPKPPRGKPKPRREAREGTSPTAARSGATARKRKTTTGTAAAPPRTRKGSTATSGAPRARRRKPAA